MADEPVFIFLATFDTQADAQLDYSAVKELHSAGVIGAYDAAAVTKDADGQVQVHKREKPTQHSAWTGVAVGAVLGILFPPLPARAAHRRRYRRPRGRRDRPLLERHVAQGRHGARQGAREGREGSSVREQIAAQSSRSTAPATSRATIA